MQNTRLTHDAIWQILEQIPDPEIPVISLVDLGVVRDVKTTPDGVTVTITPTFAGCPALHQMRDDIIARLLEAGAPNVTVETTYSPPWSTDWLSEEAREKLRGFGIAPPPHIHGQPVEVLLFEPSVCPYCGSNNTTIKNEWGPTACKTISYCNACQQPFEGFKPL